MDNRKSPKKTPSKETEDRQSIHSTPPGSTSVVDQVKVKKQLFRSPFKKKQAASSNNDDLMAESPPVRPRLVAVNPRLPSDDSDSDFNVNDVVENSETNEEEVDETGTDSTAEGMQKVKPSEKKAEKASGSKEDKRKSHRSSAIYKPLEYEKKDANRTEKFTDRGKVLERKVKEIIDVTHCQGYLKLEYTSKRNKVMTFTAGKDFLMIGEKVEGPIKASQLKSVVETAVSSSMKQFISKVPAATPEAPEEMAIATPIATRKKSKRLDSCVICFEVDEDIKLRSHDGDVTSVIKTVFIGCSHEEGDNTYCRRQVHADCVGFPNVTDAMAQTLPNWYCKLHINQAREQEFLFGPGEEPLEPAKKKGILSRLKKPAFLSNKKGGKKEKTATTGNGVNDGASTSTAVVPAMEREKKRGRPKKSQ